MEFCIHLNKDEFPVIFSFCRDFEQIRRARLIHDLITNEDLGNLFWFVVTETDCYQTNDDLFKPCLQSLTDVMKNKHENKLKHNSIVMDTIKEFKFYDDITKNVLAKYL